MAVIGARLGVISVAVGGLTRENNQLKELESLPGAILNLDGRINLVSMLERPPGGKSWRRIPSEEEAPYITAPDSYLRPEKN